MLFRNRPPNIDINLCINNERITRVRVTTFLGICIVDDLNWKLHVNTVRTKLSKVAAIIYKTSFLINHDTMYMLNCFWVLFILIINYCSKIWGNTYIINIKCIAVLHKRVLRLVCGAKRLGYNRQLRIFKCVDLVKVKTAIIMHKAYHMAFNRKIP